MNALAALLIASVSFGSAAILIRFAQGIPPISLALYRLALAGLIILVADRTRRSRAALTKRDMLLLFSSATFLAFHLASFIAAVKTTSVANATFLVNTGPVFVAILAPLLIKERISSRETISVVIAISGMATVSFSESPSGRASLMGDALAVLAAVLASFYTIVGRDLRQKLSTTRYVSTIYLMATIPLLPLASTTELRLGFSYSQTDVVALLSLVLVPTILGHGLYNYSLRYVKAITANIFALLEPVMASAFALILFGETPTWVQTVGYAMIAIALLNTASRRG